MTRWKQLRNEKAYQLALNRIHELIEVEKNDAVRNELMLLSYLIEDYEQRVLQLPDASPQEVIVFMMEMKGLHQKDLIPIFGSKAQVSRVLSGVRGLRLEHIYPLSQILGISPEALIPK